MMSTVAAQDVYHARNFQDSTTCYLRPVAALLPVRTKPHVRHKSLPPERTEPKHASARNLPVAIRRTATHLRLVRFDQVYNEGCDCCISPPEGSPIVIDLADNGITFSSPQSGRLFDFYGWGTPVRVSWPISSDAYWLALDRNHNGAVDNASELFGNLTPLANGQRAEHGYEALREFDSNADGRIDKSDPVFSRLVLWRTSADASGMQLLPIAFSPVLAIDLNTQEVGKKDQWGNRFKYRSRVELESGVNRWSYDVFVVMNFGDVTKRR